MLELAVPYIEAFKTGASAPVIKDEMLVYWYRPHLKDASCDNTDVCGSKPTGWSVSVFKLNHLEAPADGHAVSR